MAEPVEPPVALSDSSNAAMEVFNSVKVSLADLCAKGTAQYAQKNYEQAAEFYSRASQLQDELNGDGSAENAEILFLYGRSLYKVGIAKSNILGGQVVGEKKKSNGSSKPKKAKKLEEIAEEPKADGEDKVEEAVEEVVAVVEEEKNEKATEEDIPVAKKPLFQFTGDENFEDSDEEEEGEGEDGEEEAEEDDLEVALAILEVAAVAFTKKLHEAEKIDEEGKPIGEAQMRDHFKQRLADTYELLAEIHLEDQRYPAAIADSREALKHKIDLLPEDDGKIAEAHFKLSLALEFASITTDKPNSNSKESLEDESTFIDQTMRDEAVAEMELAIKSMKLKLQNLEVELASSHSPDDNEETRTEITDQKEMLVEMEDRLVDLRGPVVDLKQALYGADAPEGSIVRAEEGESVAHAAARVEEAKKNAHDLTGLVRKKEKVKPAESLPIHNGTNGKRKAEDDVDETESKKSRVDDESVTPMSVEDAPEATTTA